MGVAINDKHRVHARKKESFSRVLRKGKRFGDRMSETSWDPSQRDV